jgi:hypothetical protein
MAESMAVESAVMMAFWMVGMMVVSTVESSAVWMVDSMVEMVSSLVV